MIGRRLFNRLVKGYRVLSREGKVPAVPVDVIRQAPVQMLPPEMKEEKIKIDGIEVPPFRPKAVRIGDMKEEGEEVYESLKYPLIPTTPKKGEPIFAYAKVGWDPKTNRYLYTVVEPELSANLVEVLKRIKELIEQRLDVDFTKLKKFEALDYLARQMNELINYFDFRISKSDKQILRYFIERDFIGLGRIEPLMRDENIEDISCDGMGIPIFIFHRNSRIGSVITNVSYKNHDELDSFITRLVQLCGKSISVADPLVDGSLPDGSRLQATLATDIARRGSNFTIRKFTKRPLTPTHMLNYNTMDIRSLAYLWMLVDFGFSVLVSGGTASGKTSLLNVLSLLIRPGKKIVSIEDTAELQLPHPHWVPSVARTSISIGEGKRGEVDLFDLLKGSFRQRPDYVIVGEVRGREAYILFQQMATGHPSLATIHAENMPKLIDRLTTPPISLPPGLMDSLDVVVFLARMKYRDRFVRRVMGIVEIVKYDTKSGEPVTNELFKWNPVKDTFDVKEKSVVLKKLVNRTGMKEKEVVEELERRMAVLNWLNEKNVTDYREVNKVINTYYNYPQRMMSVILSESEL
jgi:flagellar protein FlaI